MQCDIVAQVKRTMFLLNRSFRVYFDLYAKKNIQKAPTSMYFNQQVFILTKYFLGTIFSTRSSNTDSVVQLQCTTFWLNRGLKIYFDLYVPDVPKII